MLGFYLITLIPFSTISWGYRHFYRCYGEMVLVLDLKVHVPMLVYTGPLYMSLFLSEPQLLHVRPYVSILQCFK